MERPLGGCRKAPTPTGGVVMVGVDRKEGDKPQNIQVAGGAGLSRGLGVGCGSRGIQGCLPREAVVPDDGTGGGGSGWPEGEEAAGGSSPAHSV